MEKVSAPPGFVSQTSFRLQRIKRNVEHGGAVSCDNETEVSPSLEGFDISDGRKSFDKPWLLQNQDNIRNVPRISQACLPKGGGSGTHGCSNCSNCQKVLARWHPKDACLPLLEEAPIFYPTEEEFKDMPNYIADIRSAVEKFGICRIIPPCSWTPSCSLPEGEIWENSKFTTQIQHVSAFQSQCKDSKHMAGIKRKLSYMSCESDESDTRDLVRVEYESESFEFKKGSALCIKTFKKSADEFKVKYFDQGHREISDASSAKSLKEFGPTIEDIEGEYWRIVESPTEDIEVLTGADLDTRTFGSSFPPLPKVHNNSKILESGWNLCNTAKLPDSVLSFETDDACSVLHPRLYFGMCLSSQCWGVEKSLLYSLYYMHTGAPRIWYGIPGKYFLKFQAVIKKYFPNMVTGQPGLLYKMVRQLSPSTLKSEGIPIYRCIQYPKEFVLVLPGAYHAAIDCGFTCVEIGNYASIDWLPYGQMVEELYSELAIKAPVSHDKLMMGAANEVVKAQWKSSWLQKTEMGLNLMKWKSFSGKDEVLAKAMRSRIQWIERGSRDLYTWSQTKRMDSNFDAEVRRECFICHYNLHLSAVGCSCSSNRFSCLNHAKQLCSCSWNSRVFLLRYEISKLKILVNALEGNSSAVYRWGKEILGLLVHTHAQQPLSSHSSSAESCQPQKPEEASLVNGQTSDKIAEDHSQIQAS